MRQGIERNLNPLLLNDEPPFGTEIKVNPLIKPVKNEVNPLLNPLCTP